MYPGGGKRAVLPPGNIKYARPGAPRGVFLLSERVYNFAAGPAVLPESVLKKAQSELLSYHGCGMSVMELSHRGSEFADIHAAAKERFKRLLGVPDTHEVLFMQGGATAQFAAVPLNLMGGGSASYAVTGNFSGIAAKGAAKYGAVSTAYDGSGDNFRHIPRQEELDIAPGSGDFLRIVRKIFQNAACAADEILAFPEKRLLVDLTDSPLHPIIIRTDLCQPLIQKFTVAQGVYLDLSDTLYRLKNKAQRDIYCSCKHHAQDQIPPEYQEKNEKQCQCKYCRQDDA